MTESPDPEIKISTTEIEINADIADAQADSTKDGGPRPAGWKPPLVSKEDFEEENPYSK